MLCFFQILLYAGEKPYRWLFVYTVVGSDAGDYAFGAACGPCAFVRALTLAPQDYKQAGDDYLQDSDEEFGVDYGGGWTPKPYGQTAPPETEPPVTCQWNSWSPFAGGVTCGSGTKSRSRGCICTDGSSSGCGGSASETQPDNKGPCYSCTWDSWSGWSQGTQTCGTETVTKNRSCKCTDGVSRSTSECGGGSITERKQINKGYCTTRAPYTTQGWTPKPYRRRLRRMRRLRRRM